MHTTIKTIPINSASSVQTHHTPVRSGLTTFGIMLFLGSAFTGLLVDSPVNILKPKVAFADSPEQWSVGFYQATRNPALPVAAMKWAGLTHIIHNNGFVRDVGTLATPESNIAADLVATAHANDVKVLLGLSGNNAESDLNSAVEGHLPALVANIMTIVNTYGYDGVDIDWEPSGGFINNSSSAADMSTLASALRTALGTKILTVDALEQDFPYWDSEHVPFDRVNVMSYGLFGSDRGWFNSALYDQDGLGGLTSLDEIKTEYLAAGIPAVKLGLGIGFYGERFDGGRLASNPTQGISGPRQVWQSGFEPTHAMINYNSIVTLITQQNYNWDSLTVAPYLSNPGTPSTAWYVTYDNPQSISAKVQYIIAQNLGGWILWPLWGGYFPGEPNPHPLLDAVAQAMSAATCTLRYPSASAPPTGFGASWNQFTAAKELLLSATCNGSNLNVMLGNSDSTTYVYKTGYRWTSGAWQPYTFTGSTPTGDWFKTTATSSIPKLSSTTYFVGYTCQRISGAWKCGCSDATCTTGKWQLQGIE